MCASLSTALQFIENNTFINITSESVTLNNTTTIAMGSGKLTNITITGNNVTIMCNNSGSVYCESCDDVTIEGITWDRCGDPNGTDIAGVTFNGTSNISLVNCTFQHSQIQAVSILGISRDINFTQYINVTHCNFLSNKGVQLSVSSTCGGLSIVSSGSMFVNLIISDSYFYDNGFHCDGYAGQVLNIADDSTLTTWHVNITNTIFFSNMGAALLEINSNSSIQLIELTFIDNKAANSDIAGIGFIFSGNVSLLVSNSLFSNNIGCALHWFVGVEHEAKILISNSKFINTSYSPEVSNNNPAASTVALLPGADTLVLITLVDVEISHSTIPYQLYGGGSLFIGSFDGSYNVNINLTRVRLISNKYLGDLGGAVYIRYSIVSLQNYLIIEGCDFFNNTSHSGAALCITDNSMNGNTTVMILNSKIYHNIGDNNVIYIDSYGFKSIMTVIVESSNFTYNVASSMYLLQSNLICKNVVFAHNIADNGAALYIDQGSFVTIDDGVTVQFINNSAIENGGAVYINLVYNCPSVTFSYNSADVLFVNNVAEISGDSLYFYVPTRCTVNTNISDPDSVLNIPCQFNYSQPVNGKMMHIPCDLDYTLLNGTGAPVVTSPHELRLYFPFNDGCNISNTSDHNVYFIKNNILGHQVMFTGAVFDYFGQPTEPTLFNVQCMDCLPSVILPKTNVLVDNITILHVTFSGANIENKLNVTLMVTSLVHSINRINATLIYS